MDIADWIWPDYDHVWVLDNATLHKKKADDALNAAVLTKFGGGKNEPVLRDTVWKGEACDVRGNCCVGIAI